MALDVLSGVKAAEEKAIEIKRNAVSAAKDAVKLAAEENAQLKERELASLKQKYAASVADAAESARRELDTLGGQRLAECKELKAKADKNVSQAADACLRRILT